MFGTSTELVQHYQPQLATMWDHLLSQTSNRLKDCITYKPLSGKVTFVDQIQETDFVEKTGRMEKTELDEMEFMKRAIYAREFHKAIGFDEFDEIKLHNQRLPVAETMQKMRQAYERKCEKVILEALLGKAYEGESGVTPIELPASQTIPLSYHRDGSVTNTGLTFDKFVLLRQMAMENEAFGQGVEDGSDKLCIAVPASGISDLAHDIHANHKDYATAIDSLRYGDANEFMGVYIKRTQQVATRTVGGDIVRDCPAWMKSRVNFGDRSTYSAKMSVRDDLSEAIQLRAKAACGATRLEEKAVWKLPIKVTS